MYGGPMGMAGQQAVLNVMVVVEPMIWYNAERK